MKVLLIDPPGFNGLRINRILGSFGTYKSDQIWPPYDLQIMAGYCKKNGHDFRILDANSLNLSYKEVASEIKRYNPDWVIYLTCFPNFRLDYKTAEISKKINKNIKTACLSLSILSIEDPEKEMKDLPCIDYMHWGEPEYALMQLINGKSPSKVRGIYYRGPKGNVKFSGGIAELIRNLDEMGTPLHSPMPYKIYKCPMALRLPMAIVNCSRGCVNICVHCPSIFQKPLRYRSINNVLGEMDELKSIGIKEIKFYDCSLLNDPVFAKNLFKKMIEKKYNFTWHCNSRAEFINPEMLGLMKKAGCHTIAIGCESSDDNILRNMGKRETAAQIENAVKLIKEHNIRVLMYLTFGLDGETEETMRNTFNFAKRLNPEFVTFGIVVPNPKTVFYNNLKKKGWLINKNLELQDPNCLPAFRYPHLPPEKLHNFTRNAYKKYYLRPAYILMRLLNLKSFVEFKTLFGNAITILKRYQLEKIK